MEWTDAFTFKFIDLYKNESDIWNNNNYCSKRTRTSNKAELINSAWTRISNAMKIPVEELQRKSNLLSSEYLLHSAAPGDTVDWKFYDALDGFLRESFKIPIQKKANDYINVSSDDEQTEPDIPIRKKQKTIKTYSEDFSNFNISSEDEPTETEIPMRKKQKTKQTYSEDHSNFNISSEDETTETEIPKRKKQKTKQAYSEDHSNFLNITQNMTNAIEKLSDEIKERANSNTPSKDDKYDMYGKLLAIKLRQMSEEESDELMFDIDELFLKKRRKKSKNRAGRSESPLNHVSEASDTTNTEAKDEPIDVDEINDKPFKIVRTTDNVRLRIYICPSHWESDGYLKWPRTNSDKLMRDRNVSPEPNWKEIKCVVVMNNLSSYDAAAEELRIMLDIDTEIDENILGQCPTPEPNIDNLTDELEESTSGYIQEGSIQSPDNLKIILEHQSLLFDTTHSILDNQTKLMAEILNLSEQIDESFSDMTNVVKRDGNNFKQISNIGVARVLPTARS